MAITEGRSPLPDLALHYTIEACPDVADSETECEEIKTLFARHIAGDIDRATLTSIFQSRYRTVVPVDRIREILEVPIEALPPALEHGDHSVRRKTHQWSSSEDVRLLAAIHRFGMENWTIIAQFVGHSRTRSQCSQRWQRGLDPRISRSRWTVEDEAKLLRLVTQYGERSWIRISANMRNRSDVQCRYRYQQIQKGHMLGGHTTDGDSGEKEEKEEPVAHVADTNGSIMPGDMPAIEKAGLELGAHSVSDIFWALHL
jgi:hypothetical protein